MYHCSSGGFDNKRLGRMWLLASRSQAYDQTASNNEMIGPYVWYLQISLLEELSNLHWSFETRACLKIFSCEYIANSWNWWSWRKIWHCGSTAELSAQNYGFSSSRYLLLKETFVSSHGDAAEFPRKCLNFSLTAFFLLLWTTTNSSAISSEPVYVNSSEYFWSLLPSSVNEISAIFTPAQFYSRPWHLWDPRITSDDATISCP